MEHGCLLCWKFMTNFLKSRIGVGGIKIPRPNKNIVKSEAPPSSLLKTFLAHMCQDAHPPRRRRSCQRRYRIQIPAVVWVRAALRWLDQTATSMFLWTSSYGNWLLVFVGLNLRWLNVGPKSSGSYPRCVGLCNGYHQLLRLRWDQDQINQKYFNHL